MKLIIAATTFAFMLLSLHAVEKDRQAKSKSGELEFTIQPTKVIYFENEAIEVRFGIRNLTARKVVVAKTFQLNQFVNLEIVDAQGRRADWCGRISDQMDSRRLYKVLNPRESTLATLVVSCTNKRDPGNAWGYSFDHPGRYVIRGIYHLPEPSNVYRKMFPDALIVRGPISTAPAMIELK